MTNPHNYLSTDGSKFYTGEAMLAEGYGACHECGFVCKSTDRFHTRNPFREKIEPCPKCKRPFIMVREKYMPETPSLKTNKLIADYSDDTLRDALIRFIQQHKDSRKVIRISETDGDIYVTAGVHKQSVKPVTIKL